MENDNTAEFILHRFPLGTLRIIKAVSKRFRRLARQLIRTQSWRDENQDVRIVQWAEQSFSTKTFQASVLTSDTFTMVDLETAIGDAATRTALGPSTKWRCVAAMGDHLAILTASDADLVLRVQSLSEPATVAAALAMGPLYGENMMYCQWNMLAWVTPETLVMVGGLGEGGGMMRMYHRQEGWLCDAQGTDQDTDEAQAAEREDNDIQWPFAHSGEVHEVVAVDTPSGGRVATASRQWTQ